MGESPGGSTASSDLMSAHAVTYKLMTIMIFDHSDTASVLPWLPNKSHEACECLNPILSLDLKCSTDVFVD